MSGNSPELIAFVAKEGTNNKSIFTRIGAAWPNKVGGYKIMLDALPPNGEIILLPPRDDEPAQN
jgi:hypothetical protein